MLLLGVSSFGICYVIKMQKPYADLNASVINVVQLRPCKTRAASKEQQGPLQDKQCSQHPNAGPYNLLHKEVMLIH